MTDKNLHSRLGITTSKIELNMDDRIKLIEKQIYHKIFIIIKNYLQLFFESL